MKSQIYERKPGFSQSYLLSRIVRNAQRPTKVPFFILENRSNTLGWPKPWSVILQISQSQGLPSPLWGEGQDEGFYEDTTLTLALSRRRERVTKGFFVERICHTLGFFITHTRTILSRYSRIAKCKVKKRSHFPFCTLPFELSL
jgi:hypothetical protein